MFVERQSVQQRRIVQDEPFPDRADGIPLISQPQLLKDKLLTALADPSSE
jgi:hypothetical protein